MCQIFGRYNHLLSLSGTLSIDPETVLLPVISCSIRLLRAGSVERLHFSALCSSVQEMGFRFSIVSLKILPVIAHLMIPSVLRFKIRLNESDPEKKGNGFQFPSALYVFEELRCKLLGVQSNLGYVKT